MCHTKTHPGEPRAVAHRAIEHVAGGGTLHRCSKTISRAFLNSSVAAQAAAVAVATRPLMLLPAARSFQNLRERGYRFIISTELEPGDEKAGTRKSLLGGVHACVRACVVAAVPRLPTTPARVSSSEGSDRGRD